MEKSYTRITPEEVMEAYRKMDVLPVQYSWAVYNYKQEKQCACGMTAFVMNKEQLTYEELMDNFNKEYDGGFYEHYYAIVLEKPATYIIGFAHGFDNNRSNEQTNEDYSKGFEDGEAARIAVEKEYEILSIRKIHT